MGTSDIPKNSSSFVPLIADEKPAYPVSSHAPIVSSYNDRIRPLLDAVDKLRNLEVMQEGIQLPTIVVVGDQSSGKSSVLESLAGISLPRGQGICTRVPLIIRLQHHQNPNSELHLEFLRKVVETDETHVGEAIILATDEIAGNGKGISRTPLTLVVKKNGVPDLTMVDLPGITRVPVHGQPEDIYEQISAIIMEYIKPEESIILNVLSATVDFPTCESIRMSRRVDKSGKRTLAVVTKADRAPEGLLEKVTADDVNIGLGYVCVRNRIGDESYEEARMEEKRLFETHPLLSKIDKSMVSIPVLAQKLMQLQATIISKCLPEIVRKTNDKLHENISELNKLPKNLSSIGEALTVFMRIVGLSKDSLRKLILTGEFDEYPHDNNMHCTARLAEMLHKFSEELGASGERNPTDKFLLEEIRVLEESKSIRLPNFLPRSAFVTLLQRKVQSISEIPIRFFADIWRYIGMVVLEVVMHHFENYPQLLFSARRGVHNLISKMKEKSTDRMMEIVKMDKLTDYTCDPAYTSIWNELMRSHGLLKEIIEDPRKPTNMVVEGFGEVDVGHLRGYPSARVGEAFDMKMRITAYWMIVLKRLVDSIALYLQLSMYRLVNEEMQLEIVNEVMSPQGGGVERLLEDPPSVAVKRGRLNKSINLLKESTDVLGRLMDRITIGGD